MVKPLRFQKIILLWFFLSCVSTPLWAAVGKKAMVATAHPFVTEIALQILEEGGNAVDAAVAAQWMLNVVEPQASGIGGGGFFLYFDAATRRIYAVDGRETAPAEAFPEMFLDAKGSPYPFLQRATGGLPVGVPGTLKLLKHVHDKFGSKRFSFAELFSPAIDVAENGFPISMRLSEFIDSQKDRLKLFESSRAIFLNGEGEPLAPGEILVQQDLAETFRWIQREGIGVFYEGKLAEEIVDCIRSAPFHPGHMKKDDLFYYRVMERDPVQGRYRGYDIFSMGPPSSGGTTLIEALNILEFFDLKSLGRSADFVHLFSESQKLAFQDRNLYVGDPDFSKAPFQNLLSKEWARTRLEEIHMDRTLAKVQAQPAVEGTTTSHISIVDESGNIVSYTTTIEHIFGSAMTVPGRGFLLNNELTDFDEIPKNHAGKLKANAAEGDKRPRSSMTPTLVFKNGLPILVVGSPGGNTIIATVLNIVVNMLDFHMFPEEALKSPRILNRDGPVELEAELFAKAVFKKNLRDKGNEVIYKDPFGNAQVVYFDYGQGAIVGASDPRGEGQAGGY
jgi:gamma-glutamyltranspeptidase/glutathione hydrolase